jgi:hypothetical protein
MVWFSGDRGEFRKLVTRGAGLEFITVGFYRFWLATDMRRHLWSNTNIDGDAAEYTGRARELLIGFLIALAIIVPIYLAYFLAGLEAERIKAFASLPLLAFLYVFGQFAIYRARRYRLTRTVWRGVRFWMSGSGWAYAARAALWGLLTILTLGLLLPWREAALERYKMQNSYYGDLQGSFEGRGWEFFKRGWWLWLLAPFVLYVFPLALCLRCVQGGAMALVAFGYPVWRRAPGIDVAARSTDRSLLESHRLGFVAAGGLRGLSRAVRGSGGEHEWNAARSVLQDTDVSEQHPAAGAGRRRLSGDDSHAQRRDPGLSCTRSVGEGDCFDFGA